MDDDIIIPQKELQDVFQIDSEVIPKNYKIGNPKVMFKLNKDRRVNLLCFCGDVVKEANSVYRCGNYNTPKPFCGFKAQKVALDFVAQKGIISSDYFLDINGIEDKEIIDLKTEKAKLVFPRCNSCKRCTLSMSSNKTYAYIYGKIFFTCECKTILDRMNIEITNPDFAHQFDIAKYEEDLKFKRAQLEGGIKQDERKKIKKSDGIVVCSEMNDE